MGEDLFGWGGSGEGIADGWDSARSIGADNSFDYPAPLLTQPSDALQAMQPVQPASAGGFSDLWKNALPFLQTGFNYAIAKDAARSGISVNGRPTLTTAATQQAIAAQQAAQSQRMLFMLALIGLGAFVVIKGAK